MTFLGGTTTHHEMFCVGDNGSVPQVLVQNLTGVLQYSVPRDLTSATMIDD